MDRVFVSSIQQGYGDVRAAARAALETLDKRPLMAETVGASPDASRRALLDQVAAADVLLLILGPRYGDVGASGFSPTEDEFNEARRLNKPIIALIQEGPREPAQDDFIARVRGNWEDGHYAPTFTDASDVGLAVVRAFVQLDRNAQMRQETLPAVRERALQLVADDGRRGSSSGSKARVAVVPVVSAELLDVVTLDDPSLGEELMRLARESDLISQAMGLSHEISATGIRLIATDGRGWVQPELFVGVDGAVVAEGSVGGQGGSFDGMQVVADRLEAVITQAVNFALSVWRRIDGRGDVRQVVAVVGIPDASHKVFVMGPVGNSMGMSMRVPPQVIAPSPPLTVRREDLANQETVRRLVASVKRVFEDADAVHAG